MRSSGSDLRFFVVVTLLLSTGLLLEARSRRENIAAHVPLSKFPFDLGSWSGKDVPIDKETLDILGPGEFLLRLYENTSTPEPTVDLFIAYFPSQRTGDTIHSPKHCLPGAGWQAVESSRITLYLPAWRSFPANQYVIARGDERELVIYWYQAHNRELASEYWAKFYLIADAIRMNRSDGSLVRLATPLRRREQPSKAQARVLTLANEIVPLLTNYIPR